MNSPSALSTSEIVHNFPFPIAYELDLLEKMRNVGNSKYVICEQLRNVIWSATRYISVLAVSAYLQSEPKDTEISELVDDESETPGKRSESLQARKKILALINSALSKPASVNDSAPRRPDTAPWLNVITAITEYWNSQRIMPFVPALLTWSSMQESAEKLQFDYDWFNPSLATDAGAIERYYKETYDHLLKYLNNIAFVSNFPLVEILGCSPEPSSSSKSFKSVLEARRHMGPLIEGERWPYRVENTCPEINRQRFSIKGATSNSTYTSIPLWILDEGASETTGNDRAHRLLQLVPLAVFLLPTAVDEGTLIEKKNPIEIGSLNGELGLQSAMAVLEERSKQELGYRLIPLRRSIEPVYVTLGEYVATLNALLEKSIEEVDRVPPKRDWQQTRLFVKQGNRDRRAKTVGSKYDASRYLERPSFEEQITQFVKSNKNIMLVIGDNGSGKTNLVSAWADSHDKDDNLLVVFQDCRDFKLHNLQPTSFERSLFRLLGFAYPSEHADPFSVFLEKIGEIQESDSARVILFLDGLNEHPEADKLVRILRDSIIRRNAPGWLKTIITCRSEAWDRALSSLLESQEYEEMRLQNFTQDEAEKAYEERYGLKPSWTELAQSVQELLTVPLMLGLAYEVYHETAIPIRLHQSELLNAYLERFVLASALESTIDGRFLKAMLNLMYRKRKNTIQKAEIHDDPTVEEAITSVIYLPNNPYLRGLDELLRETADGNAITFRYERVFEYALAKFILKPTAIAENWSADWFRNQLEISRDFANLSSSVYYLLIDCFYENNLNSKILKELAGNKSFQVRRMVTDVLVGLSERPDYRPRVEEAALSLITADSSPNALIDITSMGEVAIAVGRRLGLAEILRIGAAKHDAALQVASVLAIYNLWRRDREAGRKLMTEIASLVIASIPRLIPKAVKNLVAARFLWRMTLNNAMLQEPTGSPLAISFLSLTTMMIARCWREPGALEDLRVAYDPIVRIPGPIRRLLEWFLVGAGKGVIQTNYGGGQAGYQGVEVRNLSAFVMLPSKDPRRQLNAKYLDECDPARGDLASAAEGIRELARQQDLLSMLTAHILADTRARGVEDMEQLLQICRDMMATHDLWQQDVAINLLVVFLYRFQIPPDPAIELVIDQVADMWSQQIPRVKLAPEKGPPDFILDELAYPILYSCLRSGRARRSDVLRVVRRLRSQPWAGNKTDRDVALIRGLSKAAIIGYMVYDLDIVPILDALQLWFPKSDLREFEPNQAAGPAIEAVAGTLATIKTFFPEEVESYLSLAPAQIRDLVGKQQEITAEFLTNSASGPATAWLFTLNSWRSSWVDGIKDTVVNATNPVDGFSRVAKKAFRFYTLQGILEETALLRGHVADRT